jgi:hypothetical protein
MLAFDSSPLIMNDSRQPCMAYTTYSTSDPAFTKTQAPMAPALPIHCKTFLARIPRSTFQLHNLPQRFWGLGFTW